MGFHDKKLKRLRRLRFFGRAKVYLMVRWPMLVRIIFAKENIKMFGNSKKKIVCKYLNK